MFKLFRRSEKTVQSVQKTREGLFRRVLGLLGQRTVDEALWDELEELLVMSDVGVSAASALVGRVREQAKQSGAADGEAVRLLLQQEMARVLQGDGGRPPVEQSFPDVKPLVLLMVGVNGVGKTTSIAKLARYFQEQGKSVLLAAADTFRAGAIDQLQRWGQRLGINVIAHQAGADPGAVAFDAVQAARTRGVDVLIIDTAGRLHTKHNLMEELKKVRRVVGKVDPEAPHATILVLDATTGQNGLLQARAFQEAVEVNGLLLAKLDGTAKGGIVLAIADQLKLPILFIGTGEGVDDLAPFDPQEFVQALLDSKGPEQ